MASEENAKLSGQVRATDLTVSWISENGARERNMDRLCSLIMENSKLHFTMQAEVLNLVGIKLNKARVSVFAVFDTPDGVTDTDWMDAVSGDFMKQMMERELGKRPIEKALLDSLTKSYNKVRKESKNAVIKMSAMAVVNGELTVISADGRYDVVRLNGSIESAEGGVGPMTVSFGGDWKRAMVSSDGYYRGLTPEQAKIDLASSLGDVVSRRALRSSDDSFTIMRIERRKV